jgi:hypothetical protein
VGISVCRVSPKAVVTGGDATEHAPADVRVDRALNRARKRQRASRPPSESQIAN